MHNEPYQRRSVVEGSCRVTIQPSDDTQTPLHGMKRPAGEVGRGFKHSEAPSREAEECFVWFCPRAANQELPVRPRWFRAHMWISPYSEILHLSWGLCLFFFFCPPHRPPLPSQLKHQIMNSLFQQEAIRTECSFKFQLITNNLHLHSREL